MKRTTALFALQVEGERTFLVIEGVELISVNISCSCDSCTASLNVALDFHLTKNPTNILFNIWAHFVTKFNKSIVITGTNDKSPTTSPPKRFNMNYKVGDQIRVLPSLTLIRIRLSTTSTLSAPPGYISTRNIAAPKSRGISFEKTLQ